MPGLLILWWRCKRHHHDYGPLMPLKYPVPHPVLPTLLLGVHECRHCRHIGRVLG